MKFFKLSILDRYLLREVLQSLMSVLFVLLLIMLSSKLVRFLGNAAAGEWPADVVMPMLGLATVNSVTLIVPMAVFLAVIMAVGRLYKDSEMVVIMGCGVSSSNLYRPLGLLALALGLLLGIMSFFVLPETKRAAAFLEDQAEEKSELTGISPGRFQESKNGQRVIYVQSINDKEDQVENIFVYSNKDDKTTLLTAKIAYQYTEDETGDQLVILEDGFRYTGDPGETAFRATQYELHWIRAREGAKGAARIDFTTRPTIDLIGSKNLFDISELHWRVAMVISPILFTLLGLPVGRLRQREGRYGRIMVGVLIYIIYFKLLRIAQVLIERESVPPWLGLWWVHAALIAYLGWALWRQRRVKTGGLFARWRLWRTRAQAVSS